MLCRRRVNMNKGRLIRLHADLVKVKLIMENSKSGISEVFQDYHNLGVSPLHIHKSKGEHEYAIFVLLKRILHAAPMISNPTDEVILEDEAVFELVESEESHESEKICPEYETCGKRCKKCLYAFRKLKS